jgi:hypothetical protein
VKDKETAEIDRHFTKITSDNSLDNEMVIKDGVFSHIRVGLVRTDASRRSTSPGAGTIRPGGPRGKERTTVEVGANGRRSGGGGVEFVRAHLDGRGDATDATPLAPPSLLSSLSSLSAIAEVDVVGGVTSSVDADLDIVPATKEDVVDADDDGATVAAVIATPDTTGGDDVREVIVLALSSSTRHALLVLSLVMNTCFSSFNDVDLPHSMLVDCCMICCRGCGPIATV